MQELDCCGATFQVLSFDTRQTTALAADCHIETFVALFAQLGDSNIFAHFYAALDFHAYLAHDIYLCVNDVFL